MKRMKKVLLVEDDDATVYITQRLLKQSGAEVEPLVAGHGREALDIVREACRGRQCLELILLDIHMPVMDGFEFLEELQKSTGLGTAAFRIVLLSSSTHYLDVARTKQYPVIGFINKPLTLEKLYKFL
jgi:CheY-like chemotaxis protein